MTAKFIRTSKSDGSIYFRTTVACCFVFALAGCEHGESSKWNEASMPATALSPSPQPSGESSAAQDSPNRITAGLSRLRDRERQQPPRTIDAPHFRETSAEAGIDFVYDNGSGRQLMTEGTGGGAGWLDYDRDGRWD